MRKFLIGSVAFFGLTAAASAADYRAAPAPMAPVFTWTGFYIGANAGYIWSEGDIGDRCVGGGGIVGQANFCTVPNLITSPESSSWLAGGQVGYNYQYRNWVFGAEVDLQATDLNRANNQVTFNSLIGFPAVPLTATYTGRAEIDWFGTARGRIGIAWDRFMVYGTGGVIFANVQTSHLLDFQFADPTQSTAVTGLFSNIASHDSIVPGWIAGGGVEWAFMPNWSLKVEGMYYELQQSHSGNRVFRDRNFLNPLGSFGETFADHTGFLVRGGINYRFAGP